MSDVHVLLRHWETAPPLHVAVAGFLGLGASKREAAPSSVDEVKQFFDAFKGR